jgi:uncharacterized protein YjbJ (UPF0337 family)
MSASAKLRNRIQMTWGRANVYLGRLTGNRSRLARGHTQHMGGAMRQAGGRVKDAGQELGGAMRQAGGRVKDAGQELRGAFRRSLR